MGLIYTHSIHKIDNHQGPTVYHRELYLIFCIAYKGKGSEKEYIYIYTYMYVCVTESLCCIPEADITCESTTVR